MKTVRQLRKHYFSSRWTNAVNHHLPYKPRWINFLYATLLGYFWLPCHKCNTKFGGHESYASEDYKCICPKCGIKQYNETGSI